ncbi:MAG: preprotein translocase subunit SecE [Patescibacteria group bacterium]|nr:preprotein translocase subunit SecE [Patescibacteria group bacterium]MDE1940797.1 preprotein translocase subunit SecE [Patescibacteria group bacterium]MDE1966747.1 preprotein translocase subunit SecE [Patescibacteria group bacterium]
MSRFGNYIKDTQAEMKHVNWPSREQTARFSSLVIAVSLATAAVLGIADFVFSRLLTLLFH